MADQFETWKNTSRGTAWIVRHDGLGRQIDETVSSGAVLRISPEDRRYQQAAAASEELDVFKNGMLVPVRLLEGHEDTAELQSNPNVRSEADIESMFGLHWKRFEAELASITNGALMTRILETGLERDGTTMKQIEMIKARLGEMGMIPPSREEPQQIAGKFSIMGTAPTGATPI